MWSFNPIQNYEAVKKPSIQFDIDTKQLIFIKAFAVYAANSYDTVSIHIIYVI
jgi:hypothetical protein